MIETVLKLIKNPTRENCLLFLNQTEDKYRQCPPEKKEILMEHIKNDMLYFLFLAAETFQEKLQKETNVYNFCQKDHYYYLFTRLSMTNQDNILEVLTELKDLYRNELSDNPTQLLTDDVVSELLLLAENRYHLLTQLNYSESIFYFFNIPFLNKYAESHFHWLELEQNNIYMFNLYGTNSKSVSLAYSFAFSLGEALYFYIQEKKKSLFISFRKKFQIPKEKEMIAFSEIFAHVLLRFTKYEENQIFPKQKEEYIQYFEKMLPKLREERELDGTEICPCGSGKMYQDCCQKRELEWWMDHGQIIKKLPMTKNTYRSTKKYEQHLQKILGRNLYRYEKIWQITATPELEMENLISRVSELNLSASWQYASLKTGMMLNPLNQLQFTTTDEIEWQEALQEFEEKEKEKLANGKSIFQNVKEMNKLLSQIPKYLEQVVAGLNLFLNKIGNRFSYQDFQVLTEQDFAVIASRKLAIDGQELIQNIENKSVEEVTNMTRILYEDLIQTDVFCSNSEWFQKKILPLTNLEKGIFKYKTKADGTKSKNIVVNPATKEEFNIKINIKELSKQSTKYAWFYDELFDGLSSFIHLNISKIPHYFQISNPLTEVRNDLETGLLGLFFLNQALLELRSQCEEKSLLLRDLEYIYYQTATYFDQVFEHFKIIEPDNEIFEQMAKIISQCFTTLNKENLENLYE